jgi:N-succinyl-L-ornithine transcarbamylase
MLLRTKQYPTLKPLQEAIQEALEIKKNRFAYKHIGENKTLLMVFFNSSLRTRLSTQKAGMNLGMNTMVLDVNAGAWKLETERGVIMDGDKPEHIREAVPVIGQYCDIIGVRSFAQFENKEDDYSEKILNHIFRLCNSSLYQIIPGL